jgi:hypothetical protein
MPGKSNQRAVLSLGKRNIVSHKMDRKLLHARGSLLSVIKPSICKLLKADPQNCGAYRGAFAEVSIPPPHSPKCTRIHLSPIPPSFNLCCSSSLRLVHLPRNVHKDDPQAAKGRSPTLRHKKSSLATQSRWDSRNLFAKGPVRAILKKVSLTMKA